MKRSSPYSEILFNFIRFALRLPLTLAKALAHEGYRATPQLILDGIFLLSETALKPLYAILAREAGKKGSILIADSPTESLSRKLCASHQVVSLHSDTTAFQQASRWLKAHHLFPRVRLEFFKERIFFPEGSFSAIIVFELKDKHNLSSFAASLKTNGTLVLVRRGKKRLKPETLSEIHWCKTTQVKTAIGYFTLFKGKKNA